MRNVVLYIAMSLDGFIADVDGDVSWLAGDGSDPENPGSYSDFYQSIDTIILGKKTYDQITTKLSPNLWPYKDKISYIITHGIVSTNEYIKTTDKSLSEIIIELKHGEGKDIWICGGASMVRQLIELDLIDTYHITIIPTLLGNGISLFNENHSKINLKLFKTVTYNGMVDLIYQKRN